MSICKAFLGGLLAALLVTKAATALASDEGISRIAFGSCAKQQLPQPIWNAIGATRPDVFLFLGDAIYGDWDGTRVFTPTPETLKRDWEKLAAKPEFQEFRAKVPILATWDNHDYGKHDGGAEFALKEELKQLFLDFFGEPVNSDRRGRPGIYDSKIFGPRRQAPSDHLARHPHVQGPLCQGREVEGGEGKAQHSRSVFAQ